MSELPSNSSAQVDRETIKIDSPIKMARALGFTPKPESLHGSYREYTKNFPETVTSALPAEKFLYSFDSHNGKLEEVYVGVQFKEPFCVWATEATPVVSTTFLSWFIKNGDNPELAEDVGKLLDQATKDRVQKNIMREKGYRLIAQIIKQAEALGYFEYRLGILTGEFEKKKTIAEAGAKEFSDAFPQYSLFSNRFDEEKTFYVAKPAVKKGRVQAMEIIIYPHIDPGNTGTIEFHLGSMKIDEEGNLSSFFKVDPPKLPSSGKYQQQEFTGKMEVVITQAIIARKKILTELGK